MNETSESLCEGMKQAEIFKCCGLDWGTYENATSRISSIALMRELETDGIVIRDLNTKKWRLTK